MRKITEGPNKKDGYTSGGGLSSRDDLSGRRRTENESDYTISFLSRMNLYQ